MMEGLLWHFAVNPLSAAEPSGLPASTLANESHDKYAGGAQVQPPLEGGSAQRKAPAWGPTNGSDGRPGKPLGSCSTRSERCGALVPRPKPSAFAAHARTTQKTLPDIPRNQLVVIVPELPGSPAWRFDTLYAEGQRREC
jgi:hypothetical protein